MANFRYVANFRFLTLADIQLYLNYFIQSYNTQFEILMNLFSNQIFLNETRDRVRETNQKVRIVIFCIHYKLMTIMLCGGCIFSFILVHFGH